MLYAHVEPFFFIKSHLLGYIVTGELCLCGPLGSEDDRLRIPAEKKAVNSRIQDIIPDFFIRQGVLANGKQGRTTGHVEYLQDFRSHCFYDKHSLMLPDAFLKGNQTAQTGTADIEQTFDIDYDIRSRHA